MSKYRHQGFVLSGKSQEGVELELNFSSLRDNSHNTSHSKNHHVNNHDGKHRSDHHTGDSYIGEDSLFSISSTDSWELDQKFDALKQIKKKKTAVETLDDIYGADDDECISFDDSYYHEENKRSWRDRMPEMNISRRKLAVGSLMCLLITVGVVCVSVYASQSNDDRGSTSSIVSGDGMGYVNATAYPTPAPNKVDYTKDMTEREKAVFEVLESMTRPEMIVEEGTAQNFAFKYVSNLDELQVPTVDPELHYRLRQRYALSAMFYSTNGGNWTKSTKWLSNTGECDWYGIVCTDKYKVQQVLLGTNNLSGEIVPEIGMLGHSVLKLVLDHNKLVGTVPMELHHLKEVLQLELDDNQLTGTIAPDIFQSFKRIQRLELQYNSFSGSIPSSVAEMVEIQKLHLYSNSFNGTIPEEIKECTKLGKFHDKLFIFTIKKCNSGDNKFFYISFK